MSTNDKKNMNDLDKQKVDTSKVSGGTKKDWEAVPDGPLFEEQRVISDKKVDLSNSRDDLFKSLKKRKL